MIGILKELNVPRSVGLKLLAALTRYSAGLITSAELSTLCDPHLSRTSIKMLRLASVEKYSLFRLKLYCIARANGKGTLNAYSLSTIAAEVYLHLPLEDITTLKGFKVLSLASANEKKASLCGELNSYISKFVFRKLRFIATGNNMSLEDISNELLCRAIQVFYMSVPKCVSLAHLLNKMKQGVHNQGMNLITFYTSKKRARCVKDGEGFTNTVVEAAMAETSEAPSAAYGDWETSLSVGHYVKKMPKKKRTFIEILQGENLAFEEAYPYFNLQSLEGKIKSISEFLNVNIDAVKRFMNKLRSDLEEAVC